MERKKQRQGEADGPGGSSSSASSSSAVPAPVPGSDDGGSSSDDEDAGPMPMPMPMPLSTKKRPRKKKARSSEDAALEKLYLSRLPQSELYTKSYMHKDVVTHTLASVACDFLVTASRDGQLKFWKVMPGEIQFVKTYQAHSAPLSSLTKSVDEGRVCSTSADKSAKVFDVVGFDMMNILALDFAPGASVWMRSGARNLIAIADSACGDVHIFHDEAEAAVAKLALHRAPVTAMAFCAQTQCAVSADSKGHIEYWGAAADDDSAALAFRSLEAGQRGVKFQYKMDTDLFELAKKKTRALPGGLSLSKDGSSFAVTCEDGRVLVFRFATGKLRRTYDESLQRVQKLFDAGEPVSRDVDAVDLGRRIAVEKEYLAAVAAGLAPASVALFDESGCFLVLPTMLGVKVINVHSNQTARLLGKLESTERFAGAALYQGAPQRDYQMQHALHGADKGAVKKGTAGQAASVEPMVVCASFGKPRFYLFTSREEGASDGVGDGDGDGDGTGRDVFNEKPTEMAAALGGEGDGAGGGGAAQVKTLAKTAVIHTTLGDISIKLFPGETPRTVENFAGHAQAGYYDSLTFHRVMKDFMVQGGDPDGDGTGGESIWGGSFEDEIDTRKLRHDRPFTVSMANAGPNTNGSQFFITTTETPHLDGKHTVFGRVTKGSDTVKAIEAVKVDATGKPLRPIQIVSIETAF